jgi:hypothetical protein
MNPYHLLVQSASNSSLTSICLRDAVLGVGYVLFTNTHYYRVPGCVIHVAAPSLRRRHSLLRVDVIFFQHSHILPPQLRLDTLRLCWVSDFLNCNEYQIVQGSYYICHVPPAR